MARVSEKVKNYVPVGKGVCKTSMSLFDAIQNTLNTMFDIRCSTKKAWGYEWYDLARYGYYAEARKELITKPACFSKSVALQCIDDLEMLRAELEMKEGEK